MRARDLMSEIYAKDEAISGTDALKYGNPDKEVKKVAVTCIATVDVIKKVQAWGADLLITHEPTFFDHFDNIDKDDAVVVKKAELLKCTDMTIYRFHDGMHSANPDMIAQGELHFIGIKGRYEKGTAETADRFYPVEPISSCELAEIMKEKLKLEHLRISGAKDVKCDVIALCFGACGAKVQSELKREDAGIVLAGETWEWLCCEYARDAAALGFDKALIVFGHMTSERDGMRLLANSISEKYSELKVKYFDCGDVYHTDV